MQIHNISTYNTQNSPRTSFGAIHPTKYYVKLDDGAYHEVRSQKLIKSLQRKIITWLNKDYNSAQKSKKQAKETAQSKALRERIVRFSTTVTQTTEKDLTQDHSTTQIVLAMLIHIY